jgi:hypothetical protein
MPIVDYLKKWAPSSPSCKNVRGQDMYAHQSKKITAAKRENDIMVVGKREMKVTWTVKEPCPSKSIHVPKAAQKYQPKNDWLKNVSQKKWNWFCTQSLCLKQAETGSYDFNWHLTRACVATLQKKIASLVS